MRRSDMRAGTALLDALDDARLVLAFQPVTRLGRRDDDACLYSEVLLRCCDGPVASRAVRSCADDIGALEREGRIGRLDFSVLWTVIDLLERYPDQRLGCNMSPASLRERAAWGPLLCYLETHGQVARRLTLEITETSAIQQGEVELALLAAVRSWGTRIAIDDLGSGFTTFEFLARCRPDVVKVDRSVLLRSCLPGAPHGLLEHLVLVCADYSPCIVVEGVETEAELEAVRRSGAQAFQGFLAAPPTLHPGWLDDAPAVVRAAEISTPARRRPAAARREIAA